MAIDKSKGQEFIVGIDEVFNAIAGNLEDSQREWLKKTIIGPALEEVKKLVEDSRPPTLHFIGRSGHGKSSLINALANKDIALVGDIESTTSKSEKYEISFNDVFSKWNVIDSRGFFESLPPDGALEKDPLDVLKEDIQNYQPDIIIHVISAPEVRALKEDLSAFSSIYKQVQKALGYSIPVLIVLTKGDTYPKVADWPPEQYEEKSERIRRNLDLMTQILTVEEKIEKRNIIPNNSLYGYQIKNETYIAIIPACSSHEEPERRWNIDTLSDFIGTQLPETALLEFFQATRRKEQLRKLSTSIIKRFSVMLASLVAVPLPVSKSIIILPIQALMIALIGGLSCKPFSHDTVFEYLRQGIFGNDTEQSDHEESKEWNNKLLSFLKKSRDMAFKTGKYLVCNAIPVLDYPLSIADVGFSTYSRGKAAEKYFFDQEIKNPNDFKDDWEEQKNKV